jgi:PIN domain nuclease of toxin-antitoxin system
MKVLLDTHTFLWWAGDPARLSPSALATIIDPANHIMASVVNVWEMAIKSHLGKLTLRKPLKDIVADQHMNGITFLAAELDHVLGVATLPPVHKDPFDRLLASQAISEAAVLLTSDPVFASYPVKTAW